MLNTWDYLYDEGYLTEELTPPTLAAAQGQLTYGEAAQIAEKVDRKLRTRVGATKNNQDKPYPQEQWWQMYMEMAGILDTEGKIQNITAVLYGTPSNLEGADSWTAYTTEGDFGFEGLALGCLSGLSDPFFGQRRRNDRHVGAGKPGCGL